MSGAYHVEEFCQLRLRFHHCIPLEDMNRFLDLMKVTATEAQIAYSKLGLRIIPVKGDSRRKVLKRVKTI